ncbi:GNAT family N-acetyltransferase [Deferrisoma camini]|uniref:GNAT family N-acetyltransferase n=1 Tax=Deferrisoma camini TaxID=1035120 RepID=UPI00046CEF5B|nr:GNAT family N-acetyltransferase [Deferrisoma camini]
MSLSVIVRVMKPEDLDAVVAIDEKITGTLREEYYRYRFKVATLNDTQINASLVAEADGRVVGFLMGTLFSGEFGIPESSAVVDTLGVDPEFQDRGVGGALFDQFRTNMKAAGVERIYTLVDWKDFGLLKFFGNMGFVPSQRLSLELPVLY